MIKKIVPVIQSTRGLTTAIGKTDQNPVMKRFWILLTLMSYGLLYSQNLNGLTILQLAELAKDSYRARSRVTWITPLDDMAEQSDADDLLAFVEPGIGFQSRLYYSEDEKHYYYTIAGSGDLMDWLGHNIPGAFGLDTSQYNYALRCIEGILSVIPREQLTLVGHSLGGGIAALASSVFRIRAVTFNSAGVHENIFKLYGGSSSFCSGLVSTYSVDGDLLTLVQSDLPIPEARGIRSTLEYNKMPCIQPEVNFVHHSPPSGRSERFGVSVAVDLGSLVFWLEESVRRHRLEGWFD